MSDDTLHSKIELLEEQVENIERSGHFTEPEIDRLVFPLRQELESLKKQVPMYGMSDESYKEGKDLHNLYMGKSFSINVIDAEIIIPNHIKA